MSETKRPPDRPVKYLLPDPIPDTPENIARAILSPPEEAGGLEAYSIA